MVAHSLRFAHVAINCKDPIRVERFYTKHFGFKRARVADLGGGRQIVFIKSGHVYLEMFQTDAVAPHPPVGGDGPQYPCWRHIAFQVDDVDAKLAEMGEDARVTQGPMSFDSFIPGWKSVWVADPEGNIIEISQGYVDQDNPPSLP
ncbi:VOC family protein [Sorangium sp. So ce1128]